MNESQITIEPIERLVDFRLSFHRHKSEEKNKKKKLKALIANLTVTIEHFKRFSIAEIVENGEIFPGFITNCELNSRI